MRTDISHLNSHERKALRSFIEKLDTESNNEIISVLLFGSKARGESGADSDMDLAVIVTRNNLKRRKAIRYTAVDIGLEYGLILSTSVWGEDQWKQLKEINTGLYRNIQRDGVEIYRSLEKT